MNSDYDEYYSDDIAGPKSDIATFVDKVNRLFEDFSSNSFFTKVKNGSAKIEDYHALLNNLFHQVYFSSSSFALAAANCNSKQKIMRDYLIAHADEEKTHWTWILNDLKNTGFKGQDLRSTLPNAKASAYFSYAHFLANSKPVLRLGMAYFLEGLSAHFGPTFGAESCKVLKITPSQASFFLQHGSLDQGHSEEVLNIIKAQNLTSEEWGQMVNVAECTSYLYSQLYNV